MELGLTETQQMLKASAREFLAQRCPPSLVRAMEEDDKGYTLELWQQMTGLGWLGLPFPEKYGGAGGDFLDLSVLLEEMGRALAPAPFFSTVALGGLTILDGGSEEQKRELLPPLVRGQALMTLAVTESSASYEASGIQMMAQAEGEGYLLSGTKLFVPDAHVSDYMLVAARTASLGPSTQGITLFLVPTRSQGVDVRVLKTLASDKQCEVIFNQVRVPAKAVVGDVNQGWPLVGRALQRGAAGKCIEMVGGAEAVLERTVAYLKQRVQFGRPVGSFQAVQHHCANMAIDVDGCRYIAYQAAWKVAQGLAAEQEVSLAKAWVSGAYQRVCALAHQCHGAIGFTKEHDLQLYTRRARGQEQAFGSGAFHRGLLAQALREGQTL